MDFVTGHPRSGTQWVSELLVAGEPGVSGHETLAAIDERIVSLASAYYEGRAQPAQLEALVRRYPGTPRVDCNWKLSWVLPPLLAAHPTARIVHLTRDPRANVRSCVELDYYGALVDDPRYQTDPRRNRWLRSLPRVARADWDGLSLVERNCAFWIETHRLLDETLASHPRVLVMRFEDLGTDLAVQQLFGFLDVALPPAATLDALRATRINAKLDEKREVAALRPRAWTAGDDAIVWQRCAAIARRFGYRE